MDDIWAFWERIATSEEPELEIAKYVGIEEARITAFQGRALQEKVEILERLIAQFSSTVSEVR